MKKLILLCVSLAFFAGKSVAQNVSSKPSAAELKQRMALNSPVRYDRYKSANTTANVGTGLTIGGVAAIIVGIATADKETVKDGMDTQVNLSGPGAAVFAVGIVSTLTGTPLWIVGGIKRNIIKNAYFREFGYNAQTPVHPSPYLQLNVAPNGMGLAFVF